MENRVVLVTGGASGIGKGMVRMFADRVAKLLFLMFRMTKEKL